MVMFLRSEGEGGRYLAYSIANINIRSNLPRLGILVGPSIAIDRLEQVAWISIWKTASTILRMSAWVSGLRRLVSGDSSGV